MHAVGILYSVCFLLLLVTIKCSPTSTLQSTLLRAPAIALPSGSKKTKDAYVILQYGGFLLGARVLGKALRDTGTKKDLIALCTENVLEETKAILKADGWIIKPIVNIRNPNADMSTEGTKLYGAYSKLIIWNMTEYERIVYIDSDALVLSNIDHLFDCGAFCVVYRHSDLFNTGVMVIQPSAFIFQDMIKKLHVLTSYTHGDQGFLNEYFKDLMYASMFNWSNSTRQQQPMRLPAGLNGDVGMYYIAGNKWSIPQEELRIIHYTLGPIKPWIWWANYFFDLNQLWINVRVKLPDHNTMDSTNFIFWAPYPLLTLFFASITFFSGYFKNIHASWELTSRFSHFFPLPILFLSYYLAFHTVPSTMMPNQAEYIFILWSNFFIFILLGGYCFLCHVASKRNSTFRKIQLTSLVYALYCSSYVLLKVGVTTVTPIFSRFLAFLLFLGVHIVISHKCGGYLIHIWTGSLIRSSPIHQPYKHIELS